MSSLYWTRIESGWHVSAEYTIRRSIYGSRQWLVHHGDVLLGFRPTLSLAKGLAERHAGGGRRKAA